MEKLNDDEQSRFYKKSHKRAKHILLKHKHKFGHAILGHPTKELENDTKFQNQLKKDMVGVGEAHSLAALTSELMILDVAQIPRNEQN